MVKTKLWLILVVLGLLAVLIAACSPAPAPSSPSPTIPASTTTEGPEEPVLPAAPVSPAIEEPQEPVLPTILKRDCQLDQSSFRNFNNAGLRIGEIAVNFTLRDIHGTEFRLSRLLAEKPVMMVFGSFT